MRTNSAGGYSALGRIHGIDRVGLVGTGFIGKSWAVIFARNGLQVQVYDADPETRASVHGEVARELHALRKDGLIDAVAAEAALGRITVCATPAEALAGVDYVQESVPETLAVKRRIFAELDQLTPSRVILASSVSSLLMSDIARGLRHPERCVVAHPTNPPHLIPLVEVVGGQETAPEVVEATYAFMAEIGQRPIRCRKEIFGYVLNRLQFALVKEAFYLLKNGVASCADIDRCVTEGLGLRWAFSGPFAVEELNARDIEEDLQKFGPAIRELIGSLGDFHGPEEEDIQLAAAGVREMFSGRGHDEVLAWRRRLMLQLRAMKEQNRLY